MLADQLTKKMTNEAFMHLATTGIWKISLPSDGMPVRIRRALRRPATYTERELEDNNFDQAGSDGVGDSLDLSDDFYLAVATATIDEF